MSVFQIILSQPTLPIFQLLRMCNQPLSKMELVNTKMFILFLWLKPQTWSLITKLLVYAFEFEWRKGPTGWGLWLYERFLFHVHATWMEKTQQLCFLGHLFPSLCDIATWSFLSQLLQVSETPKHRWRSEREVEHKWKHEGQLEARWLFVT